MMNSENDGDDDNDDDNNDDDNNSDNHENNDDDNNDHNNNDNDDNKLPVDSLHKRSIMLRFDVTCVESENNSRVSGNLGRHVAHVTSLWCDIFTQHRHICIVEISYE